MATSRMIAIRHAPEFYKGAVFEQVSDRSLWIEGKPICVADNGLKKVANLATDETFEANSLEELAKMIIDDAREFKQRRELGSQHRHILDICLKECDPCRSWAEWYQSHPEIHPILADQDLSGKDLSGFDFSYTNLCMANLRCTILKGASFHQAILAKADCFKADFSDANFCRTDLYQTNLQEAILIGTNLQGVQFAETNCKGARFEDCTVYGLSAWGLELDRATQERFRIRMSPNGPEITVDNIEVAQFVYLLLHNEKIRDVIDTITSKVVLILGRFSLPERKAVLDALRDALRGRDLLPIIFDFPIPASRNVTETVKVLAGLARFVVADITDATEVRAELHNIVPDFTSLPVQPILLRGHGEFDSLLGHLRNFPWMLPTFEYDSQEKLIADLDEKVIRPAEDKVQEIRQPQPR